MAAAAREDSLLYSDSEHGIAVSGNSIISLSMQPPNAAYLAAWTQAMEQLVSGVPGPICVLSVIDAGSRAPDEAAKAADKTRRIAQFTQALENMKILAEGGTLPPAPARAGGAGRGN